MNEQLRAKYGMNNPPNPDDAIAEAALAAERITSGVHGRDNAPLFDPALCPAMWDRVNEAVRELREGLADDNIRLNDANHLGDLDQLPDDAVVVWAVGARLAHVGRPHARLDRVDWFTSVMQLAQEINDYTPYTNLDSFRQHPADYEMRCTMNVANSCTAPLSRDVSDYAGGTTRLIPVHRGQFVLLFRCCRACESEAGEKADTNFMFKVLTEQSKLPDGAVIDPGSPVPPQSWSRS